MLNSTKVIIKKNKKIIGNIKDVIIRISAEDLVITADIIYKDQTREICAVETIYSDKNNNCLIDLKDLDHTPELSTSEKIIDIRDFHNPYKTK